MSSDPSGSHHVDNSTSAPAAPEPDPSGLDVEELVMRAMAEDRPLPDQHPASALWWRLVPIARSAVAEGLAERPAARPLSMTPTVGESPQPPVSR